MKNKLLLTTVFALTLASQMNAKAAPTSETKNTTQQFVINEQTQQAIHAFLSGQTTYFDGSTQAIATYVHGLSHDEILSLAQQNPQLAQLLHQLGSVELAEFVSGIFVQTQMVTSTQETVDTTTKSNNREPSFIEPTNTATITQAPVIDNVAVPLPPKFRPGGPLAPANAKVKSSVKPDITIFEDLAKQVAETKATIGKIADGMVAGYGSIKNSSQKALSATQELAYEVLDKTNKQIETLKVTAAKKLDEAQARVAVNEIEELANKMLAESRTKDEEAEKLTKAQAAVTKMKKLASKAKDVTNEAASKTKEVAVEITSKAKETLNEVADTVAKAAHKAKTIADEGMYQGGKILDTAFRTSEYLVNKGFKAVENLKDPTKNPTESKEDKMETQTTAKEEAEEAASKVISKAKETLNEVAGTVAKAAHKAKTIADEGIYQGGKILDTAFRTSEYLVNKGFKAVENLKDSTKNPTKSEEDKTETQTTAKEEAEEAANFDTDQLDPTKTKDQDNSDKSNKNQNAFYSPDVDYNESYQLISNDVMPTIKGEDYGIYYNNGDLHNVGNPGDYSASIDDYNGSNAASSPGSGYGNVGNPGVYGAGGDYSNSHAASSRGYGSRTSRSSVYDGNAGGHGASGGSAGGGRSGGGSSSAGASGGKGGSSGSGSAGSSSSASAGGSGSPSAAGGGASGGGGR